MKLTPIRPSFALLDPANGVPKKIARECRIESQTSKQREQAFKILGWLMYAQRTLRTKELQHALAVDIGNAQFDDAIDLQRRYHRIMLWTCSDQIGCQDW